MPSSHGRAWASSAAAPGDQQSAAVRLRATINANSQKEPMSLVTALRVLDAVYAGDAAHSPSRGGGPDLARHNSERGQRASEATAAARPAAAAGPQNGGRRELRMNLGGGRNAVYVAPCEQHLECPLDRKGRYLVHTNRPKIMTDMSKVEFGICVDGWRRLVFKTVSDPELAKRELSFYRKIASSRSAHLMHLLDEFTDNHGRHVMVFPRMSSARIHGHDLVDIAHIARQLFTALRDLHCLGIAHLDITPTNLMTDPNDVSHIEVIDFGLACDISEAPNGRLPSRGTCGFVAPEVLAGSAKDLRADAYSAGVVLGMMLQQFLPTVRLRLLGGPLVRSDTTDAIVSQLDRLLEVYQYLPAQVDFVECDTTYTPAASRAPAGGGAGNADAANTHASAKSSLPASPVCAIAADTPRALTPARASRFNPRHSYASDSNGDCSVGDDGDGGGDGGAAALAAVYAGGASLLGNYGDMSDGDGDDSARAGRSRFSGYNMLYGRMRTHNTRSATGNGGLGHGGSQHSPSDAHVARRGGGNGSSSADEECPPRGRQRYQSPPNTPVYRREEQGSRYGQPFDLSGRLARTPETHSNARYVAGPLCGRRSSSGRMPPARTASATQLGATPAGGTVGNPGRVPLALLHAADLLRWTLQAEPQWRPTAAQALSHPFLDGIGIKDRPRRDDDPMPAPGAPDRIGPAGSAAGPGDRGTERGAAAPPLDDAACPLCDIHGLGETTGGGTHGCVHGSSSMIVSECNSRASTPVSADSPSPPPPPALRDASMFKETALGDVRLWEGEMHARLAHAAPNDRAGGDAYLSSAFDYGRDGASSLYADTFDDMTNYFY
ncbi:hypothetical protein LPJ61_001547 [Coemansia biformis]|uniref:Protein kinase domain-containing protein n=1 Tax=Coemansia biformis TaxID=1286918 RepID=A0A9W7YHH4_9FUNG|nr:hypothetical protein LPJ61_001547 [Coemansia biformis]